MTVKMCECGCGEPSPLAKSNCNQRGYVKGLPLKFINGHQNRRRSWSDEHKQKFVAAVTGKKRTKETCLKISQTHKERGIRPSAEAIAKSNASKGMRETHKSWKGGISYTNGRKCIYDPDHHRAHANGYVYEHILVAEISIGRKVNPGEVVHHIDRDISNNRADNLIVLPSQSAHLKVHRDEGW